MAFPGSPEARPPHRGTDRQPIPSGRWSSGRRSVPRGHGTEVRILVDPCRAAVAQPGRAPPCYGGSPFTRGSPVRIRVAASRTGETGRRVTALGSKPRAARHLGSTPRLTAGGVPLAAKGPCWNHGVHIDVGPGVRIALPPLRPRRAGPVRSDSVRVCGPTGRHPPPERATAVRLGPHPVTAVAKWPTATGSGPVTQVFEGSNPSRGIRASPTREASTVGTVAHGKSAAVARRRPSVRIRPAPLASAGALESQPASFDAVSTGQKDG